MRLSHRALQLCLSVLSVHMDLTPTEAVGEPVTPPALSSDRGQLAGREGRQVSDQSLRFDSARPALLQEGQSLGLSVDYIYELWRSAPAQVSRPHTGPSWRGGVGLSLGARSASEGSLGWEISHIETRAAFLGSIFRSTGRGAFGLTLGLGGIAISEERARHQRQRFATAGLDSNLTEALVQSASAWIWSATLRPTIRLKIIETHTRSAESSLETPVGATIGITLSGELEYRLIPANLSAQLGGSDPLGWGISTGVYLRWGH